MADPNKVEVVLGVCVRRQWSTTNTMLVYRAGSYHKRILVAHQYPKQNSSYSQEVILILSSTVMESSKGGFIPDIKGEILV